jgi:hypothetical protein
MIELADDKLAFPYDIIDGVAKEFTDTYCSVLEVPKEFMYMSFLTCLGSSLSKTLTMSSEIKPQPRLYVLLLGQSADDRKATAIEKTTKFFREALFDTTAKLDLCWGVGSAEGLAKKIKKSSRILLCYDEFKSFVSKARIQSSVLLPCVNTLFESNYYENQTKKHEILIEDGFLSLLAASTIQTYERVWHSEFTDIGFNNRLLVIPGSGQRQFPIPMKISTSRIMYLRNQLYKILDFADKHNELEVTDQGYKLYEEWYLNQEKTIHARRLDTYALRLMELLTVNEFKKKINSEIINKVIEFVDWQLEVRKIYDPIDADNTVARMEVALRRALARGPLKEWQLKQKTNANRTGLWFYEMARNNLVKNNEIKFEKRKNLWKLL